MPADGYGPARDGVGSCSLEQSFLAACLMNAAILRDLPDGFGAQHLAFENHGEIFDAARAAAASGVGYLGPAVEAMLPHLGGRDGYVRSLAHAFVSARTEDGVGYARVLMDVAERRALLALADEIRREATASDGVRQPNAAIVARAADGLDAIAARQRVERPPLDMDAAMDAALASGREAHDRGDGLAGITSGFRCIDDRLGGFEPGCLYVLGARPAVGKTAMALQIAMRAGKAGHPVAFVSLEMEARQIGRRALALASGVDLRSLKHGSYWTDQRAADAVVQGRQRMGGLPLVIEDQAGLRVPAIALRAKMAARRLGRLDLLVVDHLHIVGRPESAARFGEVAALTEITGGLKRLAKDMGIPVLLLAQLNRAVEGREDKRPGLADLRGSGSIEQDADAVFFVYRDDYHTATRSAEQRDGESDAKYAERAERERRLRSQNAGKAELLFEKVRDGERGVEHLRFDGARVRFYEEDAS